MSGQASHHLLFHVRGAPDLSKVEPYTSTESLREACHGTRQMAKYLGTVTGIAPSRGSATPPVESTFGGRIGMFGFQGLYSRDHHPTDTLEGPSGIMPDSRRTGP